jgi:hypothetical protein
MVITILFPEFIVLHVMFGLVMAVNALKHMKEKGKKSEVPMVVITSTISFESLHRHMFLAATLPSCNTFVLP